MRRYTGFLYFLLAGSVLLLLLNCYLFATNSNIKKENRELILKNDSLISVTIKLRQQLLYPDRKTAQYQQAEIKN